jgi:DHA1 family bicyclomycin/chloramphenicol resistance-like MFS transporter
MLLYAFGVNWAQGIYFPECMQLLADSKGITASLLTSARLAITAIVVASASCYYNGTIYPLMLVIEASIALIFFMIYYYEKSKLEIKASK